MYLYYNVANGFVLNTCLKIYARLPQLQQLLLPQLPPSSALLKGIWGRLPKYAGISKTEPMYATCDAGAKGDAAKAEGLAANADTSKKFGALLLKLVAKYPAMIRKVADPQQEYWEKIMKEGIDKKASDEVVDGAEEDEDVEDLDAVADEL